MRIVHNTKVLLNTNYFIEHKCAIEHVCVIERICALNTNMLLSTHVLLASIITKAYFKATHFRHSYIRSYTHTSPHIIRRKPVVLFEVQLFYAVFRTDALRVYPFVADRL